MRYAHFLNMGALGPMPCVSEEEAVKAARKAALGAFAALKRPEVIVVRFGDDWLIGLLSVKHKGSETSIEAKWAYVDCKGVALHELPDDAVRALQSLAGALADIFKRELEARIKAT